MARLRVVGTTFGKNIIYQLPVLSTARYKDCIWKTLTIEQFITERCMELIYTAYDLESFSKDCGYDGPPFIWDEERRFKIRAELDAAYFHLYLGTEQEWREKSSKELLEYFPAPRDAVEYIMETFPIVKRKDEKKYGSYRTKELILEIYDKMTEAIQTGRPYKTILDPPPGPPADENGNFLSLPKWQPGQPIPTNWPVHIHAPFKEKPDV